MSFHISFQVSVYIALKETTWQSFDDTFSHLIVLFYLFSLAFFPVLVQELFQFVVLRDPQYW